MGGGGGEGIEGSALEECAVEGIDGEDGARGKCGDGGWEAERVAAVVRASWGRLVGLQARGLQGGGQSLHVSIHIGLPRASGGSLNLAQAIN